MYYCVIVVLSNEFKGKQMKGLHKNSHKIKNEALIFNSVS